MKKRAVITGVTGQDGAYLAQFLLNKNYEVYGTFRRVSTPNFWRLQYLGILEKINLISMDLADSASIYETLKIAQPDEIYNLAAQSFVEASFEQPISTSNVSGLAITRFLEAIRQMEYPIKFYQASTSELFGSNRNKGKPLNEKSVFSPASPYAVAKLYAHWITKVYRDAYNIFACNGILFNHESPLRGLEFVTRKITNAAAKIYLGLQEKIELGNINSIRDWGYAPEYVEAMWLIIQQKVPGDFVIASGKSCSVKDFAEKAFNEVGLDWEKKVVISKRYFRPLDAPILIGDSKKARDLFGWIPKTNIEQLIKIMVNEDVLRWERYKKGEVFPWDASNYPSEIKIISRSLRS